MIEFICPCCHSSNYAERFPYKGLALGFANREILRCSDCGLVSMHPMPSTIELANYYQTYWSASNFSDIVEIHVAQAVARFEFIEPTLKQNTEQSQLSVLDVGAGLGLLRNEFPANTRYDVIEVDQKAIRFMRKRVRPSAIFTDYSSLQGQSEQYDLIILSHILEHTTNPKEFLASYGSLVRPGGAVFIEVPNQDYRYKNKNEPHLLFFDTNTLVRVLADAGFSVSKIGTCGKKLTVLEEAIIGNGGFRNHIALRFIRKGIFRILRAFKLLDIDSHTVSHVFEYGEERQWIRALARKNSVS